MYGEAIANALTQLQSLSLTDAQIASYGKWFLAASAVCYVATTLRANKIMSLTSNRNIGSIGANGGMISYEEDMQHAISVHLPQGFDRSVIDSRLQQRHSKELMLSILLLNDVKSAVRNASSRVEKLQGWNELFRTTLVGLVAASYAHSLTLNLFAMKNTVRVLVFVLRQRSDQCRLQEKQIREQRYRRRNKLKDNNGSTNTYDTATKKEEEEGENEVKEEENYTEERKSNRALDTVRTWWSVGTRSMVTNMLLEQMTRKMAAEQQRQQFLQRSPFTFLGVGEEVPLPLPPCSTLTEQGQHVHNADINSHGKENDVDDDNETQNSVGQNGISENNIVNNKHNEEEENDGGATTADNNGHEDKNTKMKQKYCHSNYNNQKNHRNEYHHHHHHRLNAEHNFSVRVIMEAAIPLIIQTAEQVVTNALMTLQSDPSPLSFPVAPKETNASTVTHKSSSRTTSDHQHSDSKPQTLYDAAGSVSSVELWHLLHRIATEMEHTASIAAWINASSYTSTNLYQVNCEKFTELQENKLESEEYEKNKSKRTMNNNSCDKDDEIIDYPARSTVTLGANGKPIPHAYDSVNQKVHVSTSNYGKNSEYDNKVNHSNTTQGDNELHDAEYAERQQDENTQQQHVKYFEELIHSVSFAELCCTHAAELLEEQFVEIVQNMKTIKTYDATTDRAKMLLVMTSLEKYRQQAFDAEFAIPRYVTLFAQELIRSTCSQ